MVVHSGNHLSLCGIHESGRWWDLTYWSCAEYWYDLACLSIRREMVTLSFMKSLCALYIFLDIHPMPEKLRNIGMKISNIQAAFQTYSNFLHLFPFRETSITFFMRSLAAMMWPLNVWVLNKHLPPFIWAYILFMWVYGSLLYLCELAYVYAAIWACEAGMVCFVL